MRGKSFLVLVHTYVTYRRFLDSDTVNHEIFYRWEPLPYDDDDDDASARPAFDSTSNGVGVLRNHHPRGWKNSSTIVWLTNVKSHAANLVASTHFPVNTEPNIYSSGPVTARLSFHRPPLGTGVLRGRGRKWGRKKTGFHPTTPLPSDNGPSFL